MVTRNRAGSSSGADCCSAIRANFSGGDRRSGRRLQPMACPALRGIQQFGAEIIMNMPAGGRRFVLEALLAEALRGALEAHLAVAPFDLRPREGGGASFDVSPLDAVVVCRFELDAVACRTVRDRLCVEFAACGALRDALVRRGFHPVFEARIPELENAHALQVGMSVATPDVSVSARAPAIAHVHDVTAPGVRRSYSDRPAPWKSGPVS